MAKIQPNLVSINELANQALDREYLKTAGNVLLQVDLITKSPASRMQKVLRELDREARDLDSSNKRLEPDNASFQKTLNEYENTFNAVGVLIQANDNLIQESAQKIAPIVVTAKVFSAITNNLLLSKVDILSPKGASLFRKRLEATNLKWNLPSSVAVTESFVDSPAWALKMEKWGKGYADLTRNTLVAGMKQGWGPIHTASKMRQIAENLPRSASENLTRTLQLTSYREASVEMEKVNGQFIEKKIRVAQLDDRTCLSCIELHGTEMKPGERVDDHYRGRCSEFYVVPGGPRQPELMQADSEPGKRKFVKYQKGSDWFNSLPESRQKAQASFVKNPAKWKAFKDGVPLSEFVGSHTDDVFGHQYIENSLKGALGNEAEQYYVYQPIQQHVRQGGSLSDNFTYRESKASAHFDQAIDDIDSIFIGGENWGETKISGYSGEGEGKYSPNTGKIKINNRAQTPEFTFVHETGHLIDYKVLPDALDIDGATATLGSITSETKMDNFWDAIEDSEAIKKLRLLRDDDPDAIGYLLDVREIHARAYSQYVAEKSGSKILLNQLDEIREGAWYAEQWTTEDFEPIKNALDELYSDAELLR